MDYISHQREKEEESDLESNGSDNSEEIRNEIESRLYSVMHHNDLTQPLPPDLEALYSIEHTDKGEIIVSIKDDSAEKILENNVNQIVPYYNENEKNCTIATTLNEGNNKIEEDIANEYNLTDVVNDSKFVRSDKPTDLKQKPKNGTRSKRGRYCEGVLDENLINNTKLTFNGNLNEKNLNPFNNPTDWENNSKLDFIPIEKVKDRKLKLRNPYEFERTLLKITQLYPDICDEKLRILLSKIARRVRSKKKHTVEGIIEFNSSFFNNDSNFKKKVILNKNTESCIEQAILPAIESDKDCKILEVMNAKVDIPEEIILNKEFAEQNHFDKNVRPIVSLMLFKNPGIKWRKIRKRLRYKYGYKYTTKFIKKRMNQSKLKNKFLNPFSKELLIENEPVLTNMIEYTKIETPVPVINIDCSDEEPENKTENKESTSEAGIPLSCPPKKWTKKMIKFYDKESKRLKMFDHQRIKSDIRKRGFNPRDWQCSNADYTKQSRNKNNEKKMRCTNCFAFGHGAFSCRRPKNNKNCYMCGEQGHRVYSCPQKKCLNCGDPSNSYCSMCRKCAAYYHNDYHRHQCEICGSKYHPKELCTDLWRCYHSTTSSGPIVNTKQTPNGNKCCSLCSGRHHFAHECKIDDYYKTTDSVFVKNYDPLQQLIDYRDIMLSPDLNSKLHTSSGEMFLQFLSDECNCRIDIVSTASNNYKYGVNNSLRCFGTPEQWDRIRFELMKWDSASTKENKREVKRNNRKERKKLESIKRRLQNTDLIDNISAKKNKMLPKGILVNIISSEEEEETYSNLSSI